MPSASVVQNPLNGTSTAYANNGQAQVASNNLMNAKNAVIDYSGSGLNPNTASAGTAFKGGSTDGAKSSYPVVTSGPATSNLNGIQQDYSQNIQPKMQQSTNNQQANAQLPVISGYNVSAAPTGGQEEEKATNQATGSSYYITPHSKGNPIDAVKNILSQPDQTPQTFQTPQQSAQASTGTNPTTENAKYQGDLQGVTDQLTTAYNQFNQTIQGIQTGAFPLSGAQQSLVDATNAAFKQMNDQAELKAAALSSETGGVSNKITAMAGQLTNITSQQAAAIAKLEIGFQETDYKMISDSYSAFKDLETQKMTAIKDAHDTVMSTYNQAVTAAQAQQTFNQTVFKDAAQLKQSNLEFRDAHDQFGNVIGTDIYDKTSGAKVGSTGGSNGSQASIPPTVQLAANGTPDATSQSAFLQTIPSAFRQLVQNVANYQQSTSTLSPKTKTQIEAWAAQYDPTYDSKQYATRQALQTNFASGKYSQNKNALNTAIGHLADLTTNFAKLGNGGFTPFNAIKNSTESTFGSGGITSASTNINAAVGELASTFKSGGATDQEISNLGTVGTNSSPDQAKAFVQTAVQLLASRLQALTDTYTQGMGKPPATNFLSPTNIAALSILKNQGYEVNIPGVNYTDPVAYSKASADNSAELASVRQQFPNLSPADALAQAQFNQSQ